MSQQNKELPLTASESTAAQNVSASPWLEKAATVLAAGRAEEALSILDQALEQLGEDPSLLKSKIAVYWFQRDFAHADQLLDRLITVESLDGWLLKSFGLLNQGSADQALECAERALKIDARSAWGHVMEGDSLLSLGRHAEAFHAFVEASKYDPDELDASGWAARGDGFLEGGRADLALEAYKSAIIKDSHNPEGWHGKGLALRERGDIEGALEALTRASEVDTRFIAGFLEAGVLSYNHGRMEDALDFFERALAAQPEDPRPKVGKGDVLFWKGSYEEARIYYEEASKLDASLVTAWNGLGNCLEALNRLDESLRSYERAIEIEPSYAWPHHNRGCVLLRQGRLEEALRAIDQAIELEPSNGTFWHSKVFILDQAGRSDEATVGAEQALQVAGSDAEVLVSMAHHFADNDRLDRAREIVQRVEARQLREDSERVNLAECLLKLGDAETALDLLRGIDPNQLVRYMPFVWSFLRIVAHRLAEASEISEELFWDFIHRMELSADHTNAARQSWSFVGVRRLLARSNLPLSDKFVLATLMDLQEARVRREDLTFFAEGVGKDPNASAAKRSSKDRSNR